MKQDFVLSSGADARVWMLRSCESLESVSTRMHKKVCFEVFMKFVRVVTGDCCVFHDRPVTGSSSPITGETTAAVQKHSRAGF